MTDKPQDQMKARLGSLGIPFKKIDCYGNQIVVTTRGEESAKRFAGVISNFAKIRGVIKSTDENEANTNTAMSPSRHTVWCIFARI